MTKTVRIKVRGWMHVALSRLEEAYPDSLMRNRVLPSYALCWTAKPIEKLLKYGLIERIARGRYVMKRAGLRVVQELNEIQTVPEPEVSKDRPWPEVQAYGLDYIDAGEWQHYDKMISKGKDSYYCKGYKMITTTIPESNKWLKYFESKTW